MRIISGTARGRQLATFSGQDIRPTPDRVREALFSILTSRLGTFDQLRVLDLFCGSGALSLEALSRGALSAVMVDSGRETVKIATENIARCKFQNRVQLIGQDVYQTLSHLKNSAPFNLIFLDPPYRQGHLPRAITEIESLKLLADEGIICAEAAKGEESGQYQRLNMIDSRVYGSTQIYLFTHTKDC